MTKEDVSKIKEIQEENKKRFYLCLSSLRDNNGEASYLSSFLSRNGTIVADK